MPPTCQLILLVPQSQIPIRRLLSYQAVDEFLSGYEGFEIARSSVMIGGQEAVLLDGIPGQDYYRSIFVAHNGLLYQLSVAPYDSNLDNLAQAEQLYALALDSFRFTTP